MPWLLSCAAHIRLAKLKASGAKCQSPRSPVGFSAWPYIVVIGSNMKNLGTRRLGPDAFMSRAPFPNLSNVHGSDLASRLLAELHQSNHFLRDAG